MKHRGILIVVSGFSGAGKGTLMKEMLKTYDNYSLSVSMTTRAPRAGEEEGVAYFFTDRDNFEKTIAQDGLIEYAEYCGNYYGTPRSYVEQQLESGRDVILEIEIQGAMKVKQKFPEALLLFVMPPSAKVLYERLKGRGTEDEDVIRRRMLRAVEEAQGIEHYEYIIVNDRLKDCAEQMQAIVNAARNNPGRNVDFIENMRTELSTMFSGTF